MWLQRAYNIFAQIIREREEDKASAREKCTSISKSKSKSERERFGRGKKGLRETKERKNDSWSSDISAKLDGEKRREKVSEREREREREWIESPVVKVITVVGFKRLALDGRPSARTGQSRPW